MPPQANSTTTPVKTYFKTTAGDANTDTHWVAYSKYRPTPPIYVLPFTLLDAQNERGILVVNKRAQSVTVTFAPGVITANTTAKVVEVDVTSDEPGFAPPLSKATDPLVLGPFGVAIVSA